MEVNKERVKAFVNATKEDAIAASSSDIPSKYSFDYFCRKHNLYKDGKELRSGGIVISCPFHEDYSPSCSMNDSLGVFNCFSCGGGTYWKFVHRYLTEVNGEQIGWYQMLNQALQQDPDMVARLGFSSLYEKPSLQTVNLSDISRYRFKRKKSKAIPATYLELEDVLLKQNPTNDQKVYFVLLMQSGVPVETAYDELIAKERDGKKTYDISEMEAF